MGPSAGEELVDEEPGADGEQATATNQERKRGDGTTHFSTLRRSIDPLSRASERPSGSQDVLPSELTSHVRAAIVAACTPGDPSSYVSVSAEPSSSPTRSLACHPAAGVFCWRKTCGVQA